MKIFSILFLLFTLTLPAQTTTVFTVSKTINSGTGPDSLQLFICQKLAIPSQFTILSSEVIFVIFEKPGEIFKFWYQAGDNRNNPMMQSFIDRAKPKDYIIFQNIKVMKDGKVMRWPNKTIKF